MTNAANWRNAHIAPGAAFWRIPSVTNRNAQTHAVKRGRRRRNRSNLTGEAVTLAMLADPMLVTDAAASPLQRPSAPSRSPGHWRCSTAIGLVRRLASRAGNGWARGGNLLRRRPLASSRTPASADNFACQGPDFYAASRRQTHARRFGAHHRPLWPSRPLLQPTRDDRP